MAKTYKLTVSDVPERRAQSLYVDIVADFITQGTSSMQITMEGMKPATLRAGLRRALKGMEGEGVRLAQRGEDSTWCGRTRSSSGLNEATALVGNPAKGAMMASATVVLRRTWGGALGATPEDWQIILDGKVVGSIAKNETTELRVEPGRHTPRLQSKRHVSRERSFDVSDGRVISFSSHEPRLWPFFVAALIKPDLWITLKQD